MRLALSFIFLFCFLSSHAQMGYLFTSVDSVLIGETFDVKLEFSGLSPSDISSVSWDTLNVLEHRSLIDSQLYNVDFEILDGQFLGDDFDYESSELKWTQDDQSDPPSFSNTFKFTVWELCILGIPGPTITLQDGQQVKLNDRYIYVKDPLLKTEGLAASDDIIREHVTWWDLVKDNWMLVAGVLVWLLLVPIAVWLSRRKKNKKELPEIVVEEEVIPVIPPHIIAMEKLAKLKKSKLWESEDDKLFVSELTDIIREYIENRFGVKALEMTTYEITEALQAELEGGEQLNQLRETLNVSDMIKFAKAKADSNLYEKFVDDAIDLVDSTKNEIKES